MRPVDPPPSALISLETLTAERVKLNVHIPLLGRSIPIKVDPFPVDDNILGGKDIAKAVMWIQMHCAVGPSGMKAKHLRMWHHAVKWKEKNDPGLCEKFIVIIHAAFRGG